VLHTLPQLNILCTITILLFVINNCFFYSVLFMCFLVLKFIEAKIFPRGRSDLNPVDFSLWEALQRNLCRQKTREVRYLERVVLHCCFQ